MNFAAGEKRAWLRDRGVRFFPVVGWSERGGDNASGHGNSVPRFHITWGTGPGIVAPFIERVREAAERGLVTFKFRHRVNELTRTGVTVEACAATCWSRRASSADTKARVSSSGSFELKAQAVIVTSGGIGGNHELVRRTGRRGSDAAPKRMITGVPDHVDGRMLAITEAAGGSVINRDRMWHYVEGIKNWNPVWPDHAIRVIPGPSTMWLDARGSRLPAPLYPGFDTLRTLKYIVQIPATIIPGYSDPQNYREGIRAFRLEQNPDLTGKKWSQVLGARAQRRARPDQIVHGQRRRLYRRTRSREAGGAHERAGRRRRRCFVLRTSSARSPRAIVSSRIRCARTRRSPRSARRARYLGDRIFAPCGRIGCSIRRRAR